MHIKEVCLEGFKSYATRTVVPDFDPFFNAITGLNGSGKSNILDSICFVLGITNLSQVRAANLQELVYKQGQAGVTKATVSIVFDNSNRSRSPIGYEDCSEITVTRQVVVGGRNKYLINGHLAQPSRVQNLFHSVQLNVNNPHFLIMQGRITKVLNMKPPEILSMLEEAAGTRMYEMKKESALKTLEKKEAKVIEIDNVLDKEIYPALTKLKVERAQYMQWANANAELDRLKRFCIAYEFVKEEEHKAAAIAGVGDMNLQIEQVSKSMDQITQELSEKEKEISEISSQKEKQMGGDMKILSENVDQLSNALVKETSIFSNQNETLTAEQKAIAQINKNIKDLDKSIKDKEASVQGADDGAADLKKKVEELTKSLEEYEKEYQGVLAGKSSGDEEKCLDDQLVDAKASVGNAETEVKQLKTKINHLEKELKDKRKQMQSKQKEAAAVERELELKKQEVQKIKKALEEIDYEEGRIEILEKERSQMIETVQKLKADVRSLSAQLGNVQFSYNDPAKNFDRSKVKGVVAQLIHVKDSSTATALEVAAGGKLYNVVVDTEQTGKLLLEKGGLKRRVTIIPLNKIEAYTVPHRTQQTAAKVVGEGNARLALSLVGYEKELEAAMAFVFGGTFVCTSSNAAKEIAFHKDIRCPSVTLEGDIFQPSGLLTGGSRKGGGELLKRLHAWSEAESKLTSHQDQLAKIEAEMAKLQPLHKKFTNLKSQLELKSYDLSLFENRAQQNEYHKLSEQVAQTEKELEELTQDVKVKEEHYKNCVLKVSTLQKEIKEHSQDRDSRLARLDKNIKSVKQQMATASKELKGHDGEKERLVMELEAVIQEKASLTNQLSTSQSQINILEEEIEKVRSKISAIKKEYEEALAELNAYRDKIKECDVQINSLTKLQEKLQHKLSDGKIERKKLENEIKRLELEANECSSRVENLLEKHEWIATERQLFGKPGTDYDFSSCDARKAREKYEKLQAEQASLEKRVNKKVMTMFEKAEDEYKNLVSKKRIIENDKAKITRVINELDQKKQETLKNTWEKVNKDFGSIFSTLLPGTTAKLEPPEGQSFLDGLEVRVAFGGVWKQSLSELSGGQRSLLALSLILALLLFKPAPLYILDEVDSALDLSHTQNIGRMIKAHFPHSQFIVVSLKEGMFNNANVIFRTKFVDGVSTVTRTVPRQNK